MMQKIDRYFVNVDANGNLIENEFFLQTNDIMKSENKYTEYLFYTTKLTDIEFRYEKEKLIIDSHVGTYQSNSREIAPVKDTFIFQPEYISVEYDNEKAKELFNKRKSNIKLKIIIKEGIDFDKPVFIMYKDKDNGPMIDKIVARGPFHTVNKKDYIEVYLTSFNKDCYVLNIEYVRD